MTDSIAGTSPAFASTTSLAGGLEAYVQAPSRGAPQHLPTPPREPEGDTGKLVAVRVLDNDHTTYEEVMRIAMMALGVGIEEAYAIAWTIDTTGSCVVAHAPRPDAEALAGIIRSIGIDVVLEDVA